MTRLGEMHAYLVALTGFKSYPHDRCAARRTQHFIVRDGEFAFVGLSCGVAIQRAISGKMTAKHAAIRCHHAIDNRNIDALRLVTGELMPNALSRVGGS